MKTKRRVLPCLSLLLSFCLLLTATSPAKASSSAQIQEQIDALEQEKSELQDRLQELEEKLSENATQIEAIFSQKQVIDRQVFLLQQSIHVTDQQITACAAKIADRQESLDQAQELLSQLNQKHKERIRAMEEEGELSYWSVLLQSKSFSDFLDRMAMIEEISLADQRRLQEIKDAADAVIAAQDALISEKEELQAFQLTQQESASALTEKKAQSEQLLLQLQQRGDEYQQLLHEGEEAQNVLMQQIAQKQDEFDQAAYEEWLASQKPTAPSSDDAWLTPLKSYRLTSPFGMRRHPILGIDRMHNGIDMGAPMDTPIYASRGGQITIAEENDSAGLYVQINHGDGFKSVYMHMNYFIVEVGEYVTQGQIIGYVGTSGLSNGYHLHFGISYNGEYVNPMEYIEQ